jgi:hypothetical protein
VTLRATADTYIRQDQPDNVFNEDRLVLRRLVSSPQRGLVRFDLSSIPPTARIVSANLTLILTAAPGMRETIAVHRVQQSPARSWAQTQATWNRYTTSGLWSYPGGDFVAQASGSQDLDPFAPQGTPVTWTVLADTADFVANPSTNFGWMLKNEPEDPMDAFAFFASRENAQADWAPALVVRYCP